MRTFLILAGQDCNRIVNRAFILDFMLLSFALFLRDVIGIVPFINRV